MRCITLLAATAGLLAAAPLAAQTPADLLVAAALEGDTALVARVLASGADPDTPDADGRLALVQAAAQGRTDVVLLLLDRGADVNGAEDEGWTALISAAFFCRTEIVEALLAAGADKSIRNSAGSTALDVVSAPFDAMRGIYEFVGAAFGPYGLELDYERIERTRPQIAEMLR